jgi:tetratricopeptide (TPR) repeat protein
VTLLIEKGWIFFRLINLDKTFELITIAKEKISTFPRSVLNGELLLLEGIYFGTIFEFEKKITYLQAAIEIFQALDERFLLATSFLELGIAFRWLFDFDQATKSVIQAKTIFQGLDLKGKVGICYLRLSYIHVYSSQTNVCFESGKQALEIFNEVKNEIGKLYAKLWLGYGNLNKGNIDKAEEYLFGAKGTLESMPNSGNSLLNEEFGLHYLFGRLSLQKGDYSKAIEYLEKAYSITQTLDKLPHYTYFLPFLLSGFLVQVFLEINNLEKASDYLEIMNKMQESQNQNFLFFKINLNYSNALFLSTKQRSKSKAEAQQLLDEVINEKMDYEFKIGIMILKSWLLLDELQVYNDQEILTEIEVLFSQMKSIANKQRSFYIMVELTRIQAKLAIIEGKMDKALELLQNAKKNSLERGLGRVLKKVTNDLETLNNSFDNWQMIIKSNPSLRTKIETIRLENYIESVVDIVENETEILNK